MRIQYLKPEDLTREEQDALWAQGIIMDDWDYLLVVPEEALVETEDSERGSWRPNDYYLEQMLNGICDNEWHLADFRGERVGIGIAYHA